MSSNAATPIYSDQVVLKPNVAVDLILQYPKGKECSNGRYMFTTNFGKLFLDEEQARKVDSFRLAKNEPFRVMKWVRTGQPAELIITRAKEPMRDQSEQHTPEPPQPSKESAAPVTTAQASIHALSPTPSQGQNTSLAQELASAYISAIDALRMAEQYAAKQGLKFEIVEEDIRTAAHCIFIEYGKTKDRAIRLQEFNARYGGAR